MALSSTVTAAQFRGVHSMKERPKVTQRYLNRLSEPTDLPNVPSVQWRVENMEEVARFLEEFEVRMRPAPGDQLLVQGLGGMNLQLSPGDVLVLHEKEGRAQLGVIRVPESVAHREGELLPGQKFH